MSFKYQTTEWNNKKVILGEGSLNPREPINVLIGFHGAGSTPENMLVHGNKLSLDNTFMLFPKDLSTLKRVVGAGGWTVLNKKNPLAIF